MRDEIQSQWIIIASYLDLGVVKNDEYSHHSSRTLDLIRFVLFSSKIGLSLGHIGEISLSIQAILPFWCHIFAAAPQLQIRSVELI